KCGPTKQWLRVAINGTPIISFKIHLASWLCISLYLSAPAACLAQAYKDYDGTIGKQPVRITLGRIQNQSGNKVFDVKGEYFTADSVRSIPVSGEFDKDQRLTFYAVDSAGKKLGEFRAKYADKDPHYTGKLDDEVIVGTYKSTGSKLA